MNQIKPYSRKIIGEYQSIVIPGRSKIDQIHTIKQIDKSHEFDINIYILLGDFRQTYDFINQDRLWKTMSQFGIPAKLVRLVGSFSLETGLKQGDTLSPLFCLI